MYLDESGVIETTHPSRYFITAGIIFHENTLSKMKKDVINFKKTNFVGNLYGAEIHTYEIRKARGKFLGITESKKHSLLNSLYTMVNNLDSTVIAIRIDKQKFVARHSDKNEILDYGYMLLAERFDNFLVENNEKGIIRIDISTSPNQTGLNCKDTKILKIINKVRKKGTKYQRAAIDIVEEPHFLKSHQRKGLQVADLVAYCTSRKTNNFTDFDAYWNLIYPKFRKSQNGKVEGYGLIAYPR
jgi:hypothetical protein